MDEEGPRPIPSPESCPIHVVPIAPVLVGLKAFFVSLHSHCLFLITPSLVDEEGPHPIQSPKSCPSIHPIPIAVSYGSKKTPNNYLDIYFESMLPVEGLWGESNRQRNKSFAFQEAQA